MTQCQCWRSMHSHCYRLSHSFQCAPCSAKPDPPTLHKVHFLSGYFYLFFFSPFLFTFCPKYNIMFFHGWERIVSYLCGCAVERSNPPFLYALLGKWQMVSAIQLHAQTYLEIWYIRQFAQLQQDWKSIFGIPKGRLNSLRHILVFK